MKKRMPPIVVMTFIANSFAKENTTDLSLNQIPKVKINQTYEVRVTKDIPYAEGLHHTSINSSSYVSQPLKLDIYEPNKKQKNRPAYMFIHGGSFVNGSKQQEQIIHLANYYTSRGWVFIAIDYRLRDDFGTVPQEWMDYAAHVPSDRVAQFLAMYPAQRDAKAAMRWLVANAQAYNINTNYITVGGGSAGAITAISLGVSNQEDFRDEISIKKDPSLSTTHLDQRYTIQTIVNYWGSKIALDAHEKIHGQQHFNNKNPPLFIAHGTEDPIVLFSNAEDLKNIYDINKVAAAYYPIEGGEHGIWDATIDHKRIEALTFDFIVAQQQLILA